MKIYLKNTRAGMLYLLLSLWFVSGCAYTSMSTLEKSKADGKIFSKIMLVTSFEPDEREKFFRSFQDELYGKVTKAVHSDSVFESGKKYSRDEITKIIESNQIDAILKVDIFVDERSLEEIHDADGSPEKILARQMKYSEEGPGDLILKLYETKSFQLVWSVSSTSQDNLFGKAFTDSLIQSSTKKIVQQLTKKKFIQ